MITLGLILLIVGIVLLAVGYLGRTPAPVHIVGWVCLVVGIVLIALGYLTPADAAPATLLPAIQESSKAQPPP